MRVDLSRTEKLRFLIDTAAEFSTVKGASLRPGFDYQPSKGINVRGIANTFLKTEGTVTLRLLTPTHETTHAFHVMGDGFDRRYDGILGRDFWEDKRANISYCDRKIVMGDVIISFDPKTNEAESKPYKLTLKARTESIVELPTTSKGHGLISKREIVPGVYIAESLTTGTNGYCVTSIVNTVEEHITIDSPHVELENNHDDTAVMFTTSVAEDANRLAKLREEYNDVFHLPGDKLTFTTAAEHTIPTPTIDPTRGINTNLIGFLKFTEKKSKNKENKCYAMLSLPLALVHGIRQFW
jgi:hypothetical protein